MSYSFEDFFDDCIAKDLKALFYEGLSPALHPKMDQEDLCDRFLEILKRAADHSTRGNDFAKRLLEIATNPNGSEMSPEQFVQKSFELRYDGELSIRKLEYSTSEGTVVQANYRGEQEEKDLQDQIAFRIASQKSNHF